MPMAANPAARAIDKVFLSILLIVLLDGLSMGIIFPVLPALVAELAGDEVVAGARALGILATTWAIANFIAAPLLGMLSDRIGRKPVILVSSCGLALDFVIMALAPDLAWLLLGRALSGLCAATVATAMAYTVDISVPELRVARFGWINAVYAGGLALGPAMGGILAAVDLRFPFWIAALLIAGSALAGLLVLPAAARPAPTSDPAPGLARSFRMLARPAVLRLGLIFLFAQLAVQAANVLLVFYVMEQFGWSPYRVGVVLTCYAVGSGAVLIWLAPRMVRRFGEPLTLSMGLAFGVLGCIGLGLARGPTVFVLCGAFACLGGILVPSLQALLARQAGDHEQGSLQGGLGALTALAAVAGPLLFAQLYAWSASFRGVPPGTIFFAGAALLAIALAMAVAGGRSPGREVTSDT